MADEPSNAELGRRLDQIVMLIQDLVSRREYNEFQRHVERQLGELAVDITEKKRSHEVDVNRLREDLKEMREEIGKIKEDSGNHFRTVIYQGALPALICAIGIATSILLTLSSHK